ncbi:PepSY domain-containing protein [Oceaniglobus roseus]|uniref:PepSY domain-containing protein n=1 Tax=Oceaniglobus roseus TaxID=1737570 RepID=UPI000C7F0BC7|nr:PepSY domain-containing protein [Kandeliimicrobium roseum]
MLKTIAALTLAVALPCTAFASGSVKLTDEVKTKIQTLLTDQGYEVGKIKVEDGYYEAYARKDGKKMEILLNGDLEIVNKDAD